MRIKGGVNWARISPQLWFALGVAWGVWWAAGKTFVVTSLRDSKHGDDSLHYSGHAADIRTRDLTVELASTLYGRLKRALDRMGFDVVLESDHIHIEWDPKPGDRPWIEEVA